MDDPSIHAVPGDERTMARLREGVEYAGNPLRRLSMDESTWSTHVLVGRDVSNVADVRSYRDDLSSSGFEPVPTRSVYAVAMELLEIAAMFDQASLWVDLDGYATEAARVNAGPFCRVVDGQPWAIMPCTIPMRELVVELGRGHSWYTAAGVVARRGDHDDWAAVAVDAFDATSFVIGLNREMIDADVVRRYERATWPLHL